MFTPFEDGSTIIIQGLTCHFPPEGYVRDITSNQLKHVGIHKRSEIPSEQYWERIPFPSWYAAVLKEEDAYDKKKKDEDEPYYNEDYENYKQQEWDRRLNGFWFYNFNPEKNISEPLYLTGTNYLFLQFWKMDIGSPKFRMADWEYFCFQQYCIEDDSCYGMIEIAKRRDGKSYRAGIFIEDYVTRTRNVNGGVQSKPGDDAKKMYLKTIIEPFIKLPRFFRPEYDMSGGMRPKTRINFQQTNVRGKKSEAILDREELGSGIDHEDSDEHSYDGQKLHRYVADEYLKPQNTNIYERHDVIKYCLVDDTGKIIGKALYTSTVEKDEKDKKGIQESGRQLWADSNQLNKGENGQTVSGLYRFFTAAPKTKIVDKYGYANILEGTRIILLNRKNAEHNPTSLSRLTLKEPLDVEEALSMGADGCIFNTLNIASREKTLKEEPKFKRGIWFYMDEDTQQVKWRDVLPKEQNFHWKITESFLAHTFNSVIRDGSLNAPANTHIGVIGIDGYSNSQGGHKWGSKASAWMGYRAGNGNRKKVFGHLHGRPHEKDTLHEQIMLSAIYLGFQAFYEHNSDDYYSYFKQRGKILYLGLYPKILIDPVKLEETERHRGVPTTPFSLTKQTDLGVSYFENNCNDIDYEVLLEDAKPFDPNDRTKSDITVSFLIWNAAASEVIYKLPPPKEPLIKMYGVKSNGRVTNPALAEF